MNERRPNSHTAFLLQIWAAPMGGFSSLPSPWLICATMCDYIPNQATLYINAVLHFTQKCTGLIMILAQHYCHKRDVHLFKICYSVFLFINISV